MERAQLAINKTTQQRSAVLNGALLLGEIDLQATTEQIPNGYDVIHGQRYERAKPGRVTYALCVDGKPVFVTHDKPVQTDVGIYKLFVWGDDKAGFVIPASDNDTIEWQDAPPWANWHAFDSDGDGHWFDSEPVTTRCGGYWRPRPEGEFSSASGLVTSFPDKGDWVRTLECRPPEVQP